MQWLKASSATTAFSGGGDGFEDVTCSLTNGGTAALDHTSTILQSLVFCFNLYGGISTSTTREYFSLLFVTDNTESCSRIKAIYFDIQ